MAVTDTEAHSEDTDMGRGQWSECKSESEVGRGDRKLAQVVAATLSTICAFSRLQTVRDYMRIAFCLAP